MTLLLANQISDNNISYFTVPCDNYNFLRYFLIYAYSLDIYNVQYMCLLNLL